MKGEILRDQSGRIRKGSGALNPKGRPREGESIYDLTIQALKERGGLQYLVELEDRHFVALLGRAIQKEIRAGLEGGQTVVVQLMGLPEPVASRVELQAERDGRGLRMLPPESQP